MDCCIRWYCLLLESSCRLLRNCCSLGLHLLDCDTLCWWNSYLGIYRCYPNFSHCRSLLPLGPKRSVYGRRWESWLARVCGVYSGWNRCSILPLRLLLLQSYQAWYRSLQDNCSICCLKPEDLPSSRSLLLNCFYLASLLDRQCPLRLLCRRTLP